MNITIKELNKWMRGIHADGDFYRVDDNRVLFLAYGHYTRIRMVNIDAWIDNLKKKRVPAGMSKAELEDWKNDVFAKELMKSSQKCSRV